MLYIWYLTCRKLKVAPTADSAIPTPAGTGANPGWWYAYTDPTCYYSCQAVEYFWQGYCSYSGMCANLKLPATPTAAQVAHVGGFKLQTKTELKKDAILYSIFDNSGKDKNYDGKLKYVLPTRPINGTYTGCNVCKSGATVNHGGK